MRPGRAAGRPRRGMFLAAAATAVLGLCLLTAGVGGAAGRAGPAVQITGEVLALLSGLGYVGGVHAAAVAAPDVGRQRRVPDPPSHGRAPRSRRRRRRPGGATPLTVREVSGAAGALVLLPVGAGVVGVAATAGRARPGPGDHGGRSGAAAGAAAADRGTGGSGIAAAVLRPPRRRPGRGGRAVAAADIGARRAAAAQPPPSDVRR